ncbi:MAG: hypothetical protein ACI9VR_000689 [Cognaticolwellia sp.]|jgi:hypothetical protein
MRWTLLIALVGLVACKGLDGGEDSAATDDTTVEDTAVDDTQEETGSMVVEVEFLAKPGIGPLIIGLSTGDKVFETLIYTESFMAPGFPENQTQTLEIAPGDYYVGAWIDEGSDNPDAPGENDPSGVSKMGGPTMVTIEVGVTSTPPVVKLRRPDTEPE